MRILITNNALEYRAGTELYVRELAHALTKRGHTAIVYSERLGEIAGELRAGGATVVDDLGDLDQPPDIIHGHHHLPTMIALLRFPCVPAVFVCHGAQVWQEEPPLFPRILRYVAIDHACKERILKKGIAANRVRLILNFVDLDRFKQRSPLPSTPRRALIFSNQAHERTQIPAIRSACRKSHIRVEVAGAAAGRVSSTPETMLGTYDIVFAKAKAALEAMAVGNAVILCDAAGVGDMVSTRNLEALRLLNFGARCLSQPLDASVIAQQLVGYDAKDAREVCMRIRSPGGVDAAIDDLIDLYEEVIDENKSLARVNLAAEQIAVVQSLRELNKTILAFESDATKFTTLRTSRIWAFLSMCANVKRKVLSPRVSN